MQKSKLISAMILLVFAASVIAVVPAAAADYKTVNLLTVYGSSTTDWNIYGINDNGDFETDSDVTTYIDDNVFYVWDTHYVFTDLTVDYVDSSIGQWTIDWTGTVGDTDDPAYGGNYYCLANASTPDESSATGNGVTWSSLGKKTPENGGYSFSITGTSAETTENADTDSEARYWLLEDDLIDVTVTSSSYIYINLAVTSDGVNATKDTIAIPYFIFSDGINQIAMGLVFDASVTDSTAWTDGASTTITGSGTTEEDLVYLNQDIAAASTAENYVGYFNIADVLQNSAAYSTFSPTTFVEFGVQLSSVYDGESVTVEFNQVTVVDDIADIALFESTDDSSTSTEQTNNFPNATSVNISEWDEYTLENGFVFHPSATELPINALTLSAYMPVISPFEREITSVSSTSVTRKDSFDTSPPSDGERITMPTTLYANLSSYKDNSYLISGMKVAGEEVFDSDGDLNSGYTIVDSDSSPTISEIEDILTDLDDLDDDLRIHHTDLDTASNVLLIEVDYSKPATEFVPTGVIAPPSGGTGATATGAGGMNLLGLGLVVAGGAYLVIAFLMRGRTKKQSIPGWRWYKK